MKLFDSLLSLDHFLVTGEYNSTTKTLFMPHYKHFIKFRRELLLYAEIENVGHYYSNDRNQRTFTKK